MDLCCFGFVVGIFSIFLSFVNIVQRVVLILDFFVINNLYNILIFCLKFVRFCDVYVILGVVFSFMVSAGGIFIFDLSFFDLVEIIDVLDMIFQGGWG